MKYLDKINTFMNLEAITAFSKYHGNLASKLENVIHVAGTNGKGSTVAFLRAILEAGGYSVNVFTSPHLVRVNERIRIKGKLISNSYNNKLDKFIEQDKVGKRLSIFEKFMAKALIAFTEYKADFTILEVGLGGRLDATNIVEKPLVSIITPIDFDHEHILGNTKAQIAREKAEIIKKGGLVVTAYQDSEVIEVLKEKTKEKQAKIIIGGVDWFINNSNSNLSINNLNTFVGKNYYKDCYNLFYNKFSILLPKLALKGHHQLYNASLAIVALKKALGNKITKIAIKNGLKNANWPGRIQVINTSSLYGYTFGNKTKIILDGAHNPQGAKVLLDYINKNSTNKSVYIVMAMLTTKNIAEYLKEFKFVNNLKLYGVNLPKEFNAYKGKEIQKYASELGITSFAKKSVKEALSAIKLYNGSKLIIICGSLYLIGKVLKDNKIIPV